MKILFMHHILSAKIFFFPISAFQLSHPFLKSQSQYIHHYTYIYIHVHVLGTHFSLQPFESFSYEEAPDISLNVSGCIIHVLLSRASLFWMINSERINYMYIKVKKIKYKTFFTTSRKITLTDLLINVDVRSN